MSDFAVGQTVRNRETNVRASVVVIYESAPVVLVRTFPQDDSSNSGWHKWCIDDVCAEKDAA